jgi:hypothetical protein
MGSPVAVVAPDPRNDAEHEAHDAAEPQEHQPVGLHQRHEGLARGGGHEAKLPHDTFHLIRPFRDVPSRVREQQPNALAHPRFAPAFGLAGPVQDIGMKACITPS